MAKIDGRGSGYQSDEHMFEIYRNLGTVEAEDTITVVKKLIAKYDFIDKEKVGIWGHSYGGWTTTMVLQADQIDPVFKCGIAGRKKSKRLSGCTVGGGVGGNK